MNVIYLVVDSLISDEVNKKIGNILKCQFISDLSKKNYFASNMYPVGCPTEFSYPGLTSSTYPLERGGYFSGVSSRGKVISEVFSDNGYNTVLFQEDFWLSSSKYARGYDTVYNFYDIERFFHDYDDFIPYYQGLLESKTHTFEYISKKINTYLSVFIDDMRSYCEKAIIDKNSIYYSSNYNYQEIISLLSRVKIEIDKNYIGFYQLMLIKKIDPFLKLRVLLKSFPVLNNDKNTLKLYFVYFKMLFISLIGLITGKNSFFSIKSIISKLLNKRKRLFPSFDFLNSRIENIINNGKDNFIWMHVSDIHELSFYSHDNSKNIRNELFLINLFLDKVLKNIQKHSGNILYDVSLKYTDLMVSNLFSLLKKNDCSDTVVVLTSDHGTYQADNNYRKNKHIANDFYEELYRIPAIFIMPNDIGNDCESLTSSIDIAPTLLSLLNIKIPDCFLGKNIFFDNKGYEYVFMEHAGPGPGDLDSKKIRIAIRNDSFKLTGSSFLEKPLHIEYEELYDLNLDPYELTNIINNFFQSKDSVNRLKALLKDRLERIYKQYTEDNERKL